jgi:hypothetical protein
MPVNIHGKQYKTVAERINEFRSEKKDWPIKTKLISDLNGVVIMKASVSNPEGLVIGTGFAEEVRGSTNINKTSALENCETSAIGRALANIGYAGTEYASANEVSNAIIQQKVMEAMEHVTAHNNALRMYFDVVNAIKAALANNDRQTAMEYWNDLDSDTKNALWMAPTKGGIFTTAERDIMKSGG